MGEYFKVKFSENITKVCPICNKEFKTKKSHLNRRKYCSKICQAEAYTKRYEGKNNPNFRNKTINLDGYFVDTKLGRCLPVHIAAVYEFLNISEHMGYHIHHRDCNRHNNRLENLVLLTNSEHMWLHKQFGSATLWAYCNNKISINDLIDWSNNKELAKKLLDLNVLQQNSAVLKLGEFRESPEMDNTEPS